MIDSSKINGSRFMFSLALFLQSSALLTSFLAGVAERDSWIMVILGFVATIPLIFLYRSIMVTFPDKNFIQVLRIVFGKVLGTIIGALFLWFFLTLSALNLSDLGSFAKITVMYLTPKTILLILCLAVSVYAIRRGLRVVMRYTATFTIIEFIIIFATILLSFNQMNFENFEPLLTLDIMKYVQSTHIITTIPIGEFVVFLMITPNVKFDKKKLFKYWFWGTVMGISTLFVVIVRDIAVLGNALHLFTLPGLITLRLVNVGPALSRMEILFAVALLILLFFKVTFLCYITTLATAQLFGQKNYKNLSIILCVTILLYSLTLYPDPISQTESAQKITPIIWTLFEILIPMLLFVVAKIRGFPKHKGPDQQVQNAQENSQMNNSQTPKTSVQQTKQKERASKEKNKHSGKLKGEQT